PDYMVPSAFVRLDTFPLTPNGKLDRKQFPAIADSAFAYASFELPSGHEERVLAEIWRDLLGLEQVGRQDSFFALGGHSLLALAMVSRATQGGLPCSLNDLFENPRLVDLAVRIAATTLSQIRTQVVSVRRGGNQAPLFFVPTGIGDYSYVFSLAAQLRSGFPIYVLPWPSPAEPFPVTIEAMAERMVGMLREVQPHGPYRIAGYSSGGILAYAVAQSLIGKGESVAFVGLMDVGAPHQMPAQHPTAAHMFINEVTYGVQGRAEEIAELFEEARYAKLSVLTERARQLGFIHAALPQAFVISMWERIHHFACAACVYEPLLIPVIIDYFYSSERLVPIELTDGWSDVLDRTSIRYTAIPGDHLSMMNNPESRESLGLAIGQSLAASYVPDRESAFDPIVPLRHTTDGIEGELLFCIPGAGANVTSMIELGGALGASWQVYGLQPRGIAVNEIPYTSVEAISQNNINALLLILSSRMAERGIHLLGHSFGGWVAFDMASHLQDMGIRVASLTLIDSEPPGQRDIVKPDVSTMRREFVSAISWTLGVDVELPSRHLEARSSYIFLNALHARLRDAGQLSDQIGPEMLRGPLSTFAAARNTRYTPRSPYDGLLQLVQVRDPELDQGEDAALRGRYAEAWQRWAPNIRVWQGKGNHFSVLKQPNVDMLVEWAFVRGGGQSKVEHA
ncbi:alpha/beta fold hydrolase, partial [Xanthomonas arboricola]|uniref:alpha/beta fold hydrolase n=1 Tax=Xanthomonas arboricola TaxID=56448 RepID=UPI000D456E62